LKSLLLVFLWFLFLKKAVEPYYGKYQVVKPTLHIITSVPVVASEIEQRALEEVMHKVGATKVTIVERAIATTMGCGYNVFLHEPVCIIDMGGGTVEISIISGGGIVQQKTIKNAGEHMNKLLQNYLYLKHGIVLGESTVEELKLALFDLTGEDHIQDVRGKSLETGLPKSIKVRTNEVKEALQSHLNQIVDAVKELIEVAPPEVVDEIYKAGIVLTGGVAHAPGMDTYLEHELNMPVRTSQHIDTSTVSGLMRIGKRADWRDKLRVAVP
jgi:rod shape-determining protein MreB